MRGCLCAAVLLTAAAVLGCGGKAVGNAVDAAASDTATGEDWAAEVSIPAESAVADATTSEEGAALDASRAGDAVSEGRPSVEAGLEGCVPKTCNDFPPGTCGVLADGCGGATPNCGICTAPEFCGGGGRNLCGGDDEAGADAGSSGDGSARDGGDGGAAGTCGTGTVTFQLYPGPGGPWQVSSSGDEEPNFLALFTAGGTPLYRNSSEFASENCDCSGQQWPVPIGFWYTDLTDAGYAQQTWDGFYFSLGEWSDSGPCGTTSPQSHPDCVTPGCAPPGQYVAYMCACGGGDASTSPSVPASYAYSVADCANPTCVRVPFEYPYQTVVVGTVTDGDE